MAVIIFVYLFDFSDISVNILHLSSCSLFFYPLFSSLPMDCIDTTTSLPDPHCPPPLPPPPTSFIHVSIRTCHSLSVRPCVSPGHRFSLNGWISSPWHFSHHTSSLPSLHLWPFVKFDWTDSSRATLPLFLPLRVISHF